MNKPKNGLRLIAALLVLNLLATFCMGGWMLSARQRADLEAGALSRQMGTGAKYTLYIGTNDKDTYTQRIPTAQARELVNGICAKYVDGYTGTDARGGWVDETGTLTEEETLVYAFYEVTEGQLMQIMDEVLRELNQNAILVEQQQAVYTFYTGSEA